MRGRMLYFVVILILLGTVTWSGSASDTPPGPPQNLRAETTKEHVMLYWDAPSGGIVDGYYVYKNGTKIATLVANVYSYQDRDIVKGVTYRYDVCGYNTAGEGEPAILYVTVQYPPSAPQNLHTAALHSDVVVLVWNPPLDDGGAPIVSYRIYRDGIRVWETYSGGDCVGSPLTQYVDLNVTPGSVYEYNVSALNWLGEGGNATIFVQIPGVPAKVQNLSTELNGTKVVLRWDSVSGATRYNIYRNNCFLVSVRTTTYTDLDVLPQTSYSYYVRAENEVGEGTPSDTTTVRIGERSEATVVVNAIPLWFWIILIVLVVCLLVITALYVRNQKRKSLPQPAAQPAPAVGSDKTVIEHIMRAVEGKPEGEEEEALISKCSQECGVSREAVTAKLGLLVAAGMLERYEMRGRKYYKSGKKS